MNFPKVGTRREFCPSFGLLLGSSELWKGFEEATRAKTFVASAQRGSLRSSSSAPAASPARSPSRSYPLAGERFRSSRPATRSLLVKTCVGSCARGRKKKLRRKKRSSVPTQSQPGEEKSRSRVRQVALPQLSGFSLVPFGRIFAALRHPSSAAELRLTRSTEIKRRESKVCFWDFSFS